MNFGERPLWGPTPASNNSLSPRTPAACPRECLEYLSSHPGMLISLELGTRYMRCAVSQHCVQSPQQGIVTHPSPPIYRAALEGGWLALGSPPVCEARLYEELTLCFAQLLTRGLLVGVEGCQVVVSEPLGMGDGLRGVVERSLVRGVGVRSVAFCPQATASAVGVGAWTALVVDVGESCTRVTPVVQGALLARVAREVVGVGGGVLNALTGAVLLSALAGIATPAAAPLPAPASASSSAPEAYGHSPNLPWTQGLRDEDLPPHKKSPALSTLVYNREPLQGWIAACLKWKGVGREGMEEEEEKEKEERVDTQQLPLPLTLLLAALGLSPIPGATLPIPTSLWIPLLPAHAHKLILSTPHLCALAMDVEQHLCAALGGWEATTTTGEEGALAGGMAVAESGINHPFTRAMRDTLTALRACMGLLLTTPTSHQSFSLAGAVAGVLMGAPVDARRPLACSVVVCGGGGGGGGGEGGARFRAGLIEGVRGLVGRESGGVGEGGTGTKLWKGGSVGKGGVVLVKRQGRGEGGAFSLLAPLLPHLAFKHSLVQGAPQSLTGFLGLAALSLALEAQALLPTPPPPMSSGSTTATVAAAAAAAAGPSEKGLAKVGGAASAPAAATTAAATTAAATTAAASTRERLERMAQKMQAGRGGGGGKKTTG